MFTHGLYSRDVQANVGSAWYKKVAPSDIHSRSSVVKETKRQRPAARPKRNERKNTHRHRNTDSKIGPGGYENRPETKKNDQKPKKTTETQGPCPDLRGFCIKPLTVPDPWGAAGPWSPRSLLGSSRPPAALRTLPQLWEVAGGGSNPPNRGLGGGSPPAESKGTGIGRRRTN